jgi:hypothetical protein
MWPHIWYGHQAGALSHIWSFLDSHAGAIQAILTIVLVGATLWANHRTREALKLAREQYETEWRPSVHIRIHSVSESKIRIVNMGRMAIIVTDLILRFEGGNDKGIPKVLDWVLTPAQPDELSLESTLVDAIRLTNRLPEYGTEATFPVDIRADYTALGRPYSTQWFRYSCRVKTGVTGTGGVRTSLTYRETP